MNLPEPHVIECISDKFRQYLLASGAGIPVPKTFFAQNMGQVYEVIDEIPIPAFIKGAEVTLWRQKIGVAAKGFIVNNKRRGNN